MKKKLQVFNQVQTFKVQIQMDRAMNSVNGGMPVSGMSKENKKFQVKYQKCTYSKGHYVHVSGNI